MSVFDVAIVGGGPTGLTLANALGQQRVSTVLLERNSMTASEPRAVIIDDESMRFLQALGLAEAMRGSLREGRATRYLAHAHARRPFAEVDPRGMEYGWPRRLRIHQPDLERVLRVGLERWPSVVARYDAAVETIEVETTAAMLRMAGGGTISARRVIACDGGGSSIRRQLGIATTGDSYQEPWLVLDLVDDPFDPPDTLIVCDPHRPAVSVPGPHRRRRFEFMIKHSEDRQAFLEPARIARLLSDYGYGPGAPASIERKTIYVFHARSAVSWRQGPVLLAGDAAHMMPPFMGQGLNSCLRDSWNLGWKLALEARGVGGGELVDSYEVERRPHVEKMIATSVTVAELAMTTNRLKAMVRNLLFTVARGVPAVRRHINGQFFKPRPEVDAGLFLMPEGERGLVGRMVPQPTLGDGRMLDELLGTGFAVVGMGVVPILVHPIWRDLRAIAVTLEAADVAAHPAFARHAGRLLLVRPDRYVAAAFDPVEGDAVAARFARLLGDAASLRRAA